MTLGSDLAPVFLTLTCLATYTYIYGELLPSVAFTALGVFIRLEGVLGCIPRLMVLVVDAKVSCDRIEGSFACQKRTKIRTRETQYRFIMRL